MKRGALVKTSGPFFRWSLPPVKARCPDFLRRLVALVHSMRLYLMKSAHAELSNTAWQEIGVKPILGLEWDTTLSNHTFRFWGYNCPPRARESKVG